MIRDCESFKMSTSAGDYVTYGRFTTEFAQIQAGGPFGDPYISVMSYYNGGQLIRRMVPGGPFSTLFFSGRLLLGSGLGTQFSISAFDAVNQANQVSVNFFGLSGVISITCNGVTLLTTAPGQFPLSAWFWCSIKFVIGSGAAGAVGVQIGPVLKINLTGVNTQTTARGYCDTTEFVSSGGNTSMQHMIWNDATGTYNNSYASDQRVVGELPTAAGDTTQLTPVGNASNYLNAAECPPTGDTDYNYSGTVGNLDLYKGGVPAGVTGVGGVMVSAVARKDDSGSRSLATQLKSGGTLASGATVPMASSYTTQSDVWETDPSTGVPFTAAALAALQWGAKVAA